MGAEMTRKDQPYQLATQVGTERLETNFEELSDAMSKYHEVFSHQFPPLPQKPVLSDFHMAFIALSRLGLEESCGTWKTECYGNNITFS